MLRNPQPFEIEVEGRLCVGIPLTQGQFAIIDLVDLLLIAPYRWHAMKRSNSYYARRSVRFGDNWKLIYMPTAILGPPAELWDHRNGNGLDNRRCNLRPATFSQNKQNCRMAVGKQYKGTSFVRREGKWCAEIHGDVKKHHLGYFETEEEAAHAYDSAAFEAFGAFACLNFPRDSEHRRATQLQYGQI